MAITVALDDDIYESARSCASAVGLSLSEWLHNAVRAAARRQDAAACIAWKPGVDPAGLADLDEVGEVGEQTGPVGLRGFGAVDPA
jgi:hypothetical protein